MSCCKENELYLNWKDNYNVDHLVETLQTLFGWTYLQSKIVTETTQRNGKCLLIRETNDRIQELTLKLASANLSFQVKAIDKIK